MRTLKLYDYLAIQPEVLIDLEKMASSLSHLPHQHAVAIQVLIVHHNFLENGRMERMPYDSQLLMQDDGVMYRDLYSLPAQLLNIIHHYLEMAKRFTCAYGCQS